MGTGPHIGLLLSKDDGDCISDIMDSYNKQFDAIFCLDASSDNSLEVIRSYDKVVYAVSEKELGIDGSPMRDGIRQLLLPKIQEKFGYDGWIFPIHTDEMLVGDPKKLADFAESEGTNQLQAVIAHFILHYDDCERAHLPSVCERNLYYFMAAPENIGFKNKNGLYYTLGKHMYVLPDGCSWRTCSKFMIRKHYNMRTPDQLTKRIEERVKTGWQPAYARLQDDLYISDVHKFAGGSELSYIQKFDGEFRFAPQYTDNWKGKII